MQVGFSVVKQREFSPTLVEYSCFVDGVFLRKLYVHNETGEENCNYCKLNNDACRFREIQHYAESIGLCRPAVLWVKPTGLGFDVYYDEKELFRFFFYPGYRWDAPYLFSESDELLVTVGPTVTFHRAYDRVAGVYFEYPIDTAAPKGRELLHHIVLSFAVQIAYENEPDNNLIEFVTALHDLITPAE